MKGPTHEHITTVTGVTDVTSVTAMGSLMPSRKSSRSIASLHRNAGGLRSGRTGQIAVGDGARAAARRRSALQQAIKVVAPIHRFRIGAAAQRKQPSKSSCAVGPAGRMLVST
jgi:hypothetical protein